MVIAAAPKGNAQNYSSDGNPGDTRSGEVISIFAANEALYYIDANLNSRSTNAVTDISYTTSPEYGFSMNVNIQDLNFVTPGDVINYTAYRITNEGNTDLPYTGSYYFSYGGGASGWTVEVRDDGGTIFSLVPNTISSETLSLSDDTDTDTASRFYWVYVSPLAANSPAGSYIDVYTTYETTATPVGSYEGANTLFYGGTSEARDYFRDLIAAPQMVISRAAKVDSPVEYGGNADDPVPGAVVTFTYNYTNEGNASAENVILVAKVPTNEAPGSGTNLAHINGSGNRGYVTLTPQYGTAADWNVYYTTEAAPLPSERATYEAPGWTFIGMLDGTSAASWPAGLYASSDTEFAATYVKWEKSEVASNESETIVWGVTIR